MTRGIDFIITVSDDGSDEIKRLQDKISYQPHQQLVVADRVLLKCMTICPYQNSYDQTNTICINESTARETPNCIWLIQCQLDTISFITDVVDSFSDRTDCASY